MRIAAEERETAEQIRWLECLIGGTEKLPYGGAAQVVIFLAVREHRRNFALLGGAHRTMVMKSFFRKRLHRPAFHAGRHDRDPIDAARVVGHIPADLVEALASKELARS